MITIKETKSKIISDPKWWKIAFFDWVDDFRRCKSPSAIAEPFELGDDQMDSLLASTIEFLCDELELVVPDWVGQIPACRKPYFVSGIENLKATAIVESPAHFRVRKIFVTESFLTRV